MLRIDDNLSAVLRVAASYNERWASVRSGVAKLADSLSKLVVRSYAPKRRAVLWTSAALLAGGVLYAAFELARYDAGFRGADSGRGALSASRRIRSLQSDNDNHRRQPDAAETARSVG